jgi:hypothetical protein
LLAHSRVAVQQKNNTPSSVSSGLSLPSTEQMLGDWEKRQASFTSVDALRKAYPQPVKLPTTLGNFQHYYLTKGETPKDTEIHIYDGNGVNGIQLHIYQGAKPDFKTWLEQETKDKSAGIFKGDKLPTIINFHGSDALAGEPGYNDVFGNKEPRPGVFSWWENGTIYELYGTPGENGTSLNDLINIANSLQ